MSNRSATKPRPMICRCSRCGLQEVVLGTGERYQGRLVSFTEYKSHREAERVATQLALRFDGMLTLKEPSGLHTLPDTENSSPTSDNLPTISPEADMQTMDRLRCICTRLDRNEAKDLANIATFVFERPPTRDSLGKWTSLSGENLEESLALKHDIIENGPFLEYENWLYLSYESVEDLIMKFRSNLKHQADLKSLLQRLGFEVRLALELKKSAWESLQKTLSNISEYSKIVCTAQHRSNRLGRCNPTIAAGHILIGFMHLTCGVSLANCKVLISGIQTVLSTTSPHLAKGIANDPETAIALLDLKPRIKTFVCCPRCFQTYPSDHPFLFCTSKTAPQSSECGTRLFSRKKKGDAISEDHVLHEGRADETQTYPQEGIRRAQGIQKESPIRVFDYHELEDYISRLYSSSELERHLDKDMFRRKGGPTDNTIWDIQDAPILRDFLGPDNSTRFLHRPGNEGRLVFSLNMDGFNPLTNKESGKKVSVGAIYLACLNLPAGLRYNVENIFLVGIIPGPSEPSKEEINYLLRPLVDDLLIFWNHGFFLISTPGHPSGRLVRGAVVPLVCDLPAMRQMSGCASHSSRNFCSFCTLKTDDISNLDSDSWGSRSREEHMRFAIQWRDAESAKRKEELYTHSGIRWSELLRLPYWDPTRFVTIDSMHGFYLRMFQRHIRQVWGMSIDHKDGDGPCVGIPEEEKPPYEEMIIARQVLRTQSEKKLRQLKVNALKELSQAAGLSHSGFKKQLVGNLLKYRISRGWFDENGKMLGSGEDTLAYPTQFPKAPVRRLAKSRRPVNDLPTTAEVEEGLSMLLCDLKKKLKSMRKALLKHICNLKGIDLPDVCSVSEIVDLIEDWRSNNNIIDSTGQPKLGGSNRKVRGTKVLGRETLREIRADMDKLGLPSWVAHSPSQPGSAKGGKFTADQWRSFCTINLVFTLTRLWGSEPEGSRKRRMLDNFLDLVQAVKLASMRSTTPERISRYTFHMHRYLVTLLELYPGTSISPYQHLSLHFPALLHRLGPVHSWRCYPFERYNYLLQHIPTNMKFGQLERTMFNKFCMGQRLRSLFKSAGIPSELHALVLKWEKRYEKDIRGTLRADAFAYDTSFRSLEESITWTNTQETNLPPEWFKLMKHWLKVNEKGAFVGPLSSRAFKRDCVSRLGEIYRTATSSQNDSNIYYRVYDSVGAGSIEGIFSHTRIRENGDRRARTFFIVRQYRDILPNLAQYDSFRRFPELCGRIYQDSFLLGPTIISSDELLHHFSKGFIALPEITSRFFCAIPLDKC